MKKILIIPSNTDLNRGDQALVWESARLVKDIYGEDTKVILMDSGDLDQIHQTRLLGYDMITPILKHPSRIHKNNKINYDFITVILWGIRAVLDFIKTSMLLSRCDLINRFASLFFDKSELMSLQTFRDCDAVFVKGGGFLHSYGGLTDAYLFYYYLFDFKLALRYKKPVVLLPNSIGPLKNKIAKKLLEKTLKRCTMVYTRESKSQNYIDLHTSIKSVQSLDLAFYQESSRQDFKSYLTDKGVNFSKKNVLLTLRPYRFPGSANPGEKYLDYLNSIKDFVMFLRQNDYDVTFFAHTLGPSLHENDSLAIKKVLSLIDNTNGITYIEDKNLNCQDVQKIYSYFDCVIGTRFHSVIFAINSLIPTIAITYGGNKGQGIMSDLNLSKYSIPIDNVTSAELINRFTDLMDNTDQFKYDVKVLLSYAQRERKSIINQLQSKLI